MGLQPCGCLAAKVGSVANMTDCMLQRHYRRRRRRLRFAWSIYIALMTNHTPNSATITMFDTEISPSPINDWRETFCIKGFNVVGLLKNLANKKGFRIFIMGLRVTKQHSDDNVYLATPCTAHHITNALAQPFDSRAARREQSKFHCERCTTS